MILEFRLTRATYRVIPIRLERLADLRHTDCAEKVRDEALCRLLHLERREALRLTIWRLNIKRDLDSVARGLTLFFVALVVAALAA